MFFDALWELGWVQYIEGNFDSAKNNFSNLAHLSKSTSLKEKGFFWEAKCYQKLGDTEKAIDTYKKIIDIKSYSYYFFSSADLLKDFKVDIFIPEITKPDKSFLFFEIFEDVDKSSDKEKPKDTDNMDIENNGENIYIYSHIEKAKELIILELYQSSSLEIEAGSGEIEENPEGILELSTLFLESHDYGRSVNLIRKNFTRLKSNLTGPYKDYFYYLAYPYGYKDIVDKYSSTYNIEPLFTLAVIREESSFKPDAKSFAGALGLMQIMPSTGRGIAEKIDIYGFSEDVLLDTETNIEMGTFYLREMLDRFNQNKFYALGAYNGGPGNMNRWLSRWGDRDIDEFIETIPFDETRNYIRRVMGSY